MSPRRIACPPVVALLASLALLLGGGCKKLDGSAPFAPLDRPFFDCKVQSVVTKLCSGFACHGDAARYYTVFARNRLRFGGTEDDRGATMKQIERDFDFNAARIYVDLEDRANSQLLMKPLEEAAGGSFHRGAEIFAKGDVFASRDDPDFKVLQDWIVNGATEQPDCIEPGSDE